MKLHVLTAVWGAAFIESFCKLTIRSLLAPGNLADTAARHSVRYTIFTTQKDIARLEDDPFFRRLAQSVDISCVPFSEFSVNTCLSSSHWELWRQGLRQARDAGETIVTVAADHLFSAGTFARWIHLFEEGYRAIYCPGIQVARETVMPELDERFPENGPPGIAIDRDDLHRLVLRHLHPSNLVMMRDGRRMMSHPEYQVRALPGEGIALRILASHAVCVDPTHFSLREDFCPLDRIDDIAFETCTFASVEPILKNLQEYYYPRVMDGAALGHLGRWMDVFSTPANRRESGKTHFLGFGADVDSGRRRRADLASAAYVAQMNISRSIYRLWHRLHEEGLSQAARWLAAAHMHGRLRRRLVLRGPATLFVPGNGALAGLDAETVGTLLRDSGQALIELIGNHVAEGHPVAPGCRRLRLSPDGAPLLSGRRFAAGRTGEVRILRGPIELDGLYLYVIDRPLVAPPGAATVRASALEDIEARARGRGIKAAKSFVMRHTRLRRLATRVLTGGTRPSRGADAPDAVADTLRRGLTRRALEILCELYDCYQQEVVDGSSATICPRALIRRLLDDDEMHTETLFSELLDARPDCAEAWYEKAALLLRAGTADSAADALERAVAGRPILEKGPHDVDVRVIAALALASLRDGTGDNAGALSALEQVGALHPLPWRYHFERGRLLLAASRPLEALDCFNKSMGFDRVMWSLPFLPKNIPV